MLFSEAYKAEKEALYKVARPSRFVMHFNDDDIQWLKEERRLLGYKGNEFTVQSVKDQIQSEIRRGTLHMPWRWIKPNTLALNYLQHKGYLPSS